MGVLVGLVYRKIDSYGLFTTITVLLSTVKRARGKGVSQSFSQSEIDVIKWMVGRNVHSFNVLGGLNVPEDVRLLMNMRGSSSDWCTGGPKTLKTPRT